MQYCAVNDGLKVLRSLARRFLPAATANTILYAARFAAAEALLLQTTYIF